MLTYRDRATYDRAMKGMSADPDWKTVAELGVPFYLHPRNPLPGAVPSYVGHNWLLGPNWAFHAETAVHALRLIGSGLFDEHPNLQICQIASKSDPASERAQVIDSTGESFSLVGSRFASNPDPTKF